MGIQFYGGERIQKGRGIGGLLRLLKSVFMPAVKSVGKIQKRERVPGRMVVTC